MRQQGPSSGRGNQHLLQIHVIVGICLGIGFGLLRLFGHNHAQTDISPFRSATIFTGIALLGTLITHTDDGLETKISFGTSCKLTLALSIVFFLTYLVSDSVCRAICG